MKAYIGIPLALGTAAVLSTLILVPGYKKHRAAAAEMAALYAPHDPDQYKFPLCTSNDNDWGLYRSKINYAWYVVKGKDALPERITGDWSQYPELSNLYCSESK